MLPALANDQTFGSQAEQVDEAVQLTTLSSGLSHPMVDSETLLSKTAQVDDALGGTLVVCWRLPPSRVDSVEYQRSTVAAILRAAYDDGSICGSCPTGQLSGFDAPGTCESVQ